MLLSATESMTIRFPFSSSDFLSLLTPVKSIVSLNALSACEASVPVVLPGLLLEQALRRTAKLVSRINIIFIFFFIIYSSVLLEVFLFLFKT